MTNTVSVIGLGKLGAPMAACFAAKGFQVVGVDSDVKKAESMRQAKSPVFEPHLPELLAASDGRLQATDDIEAATLGTDVTFIVVATPSEPGGGFSLQYVLPVCERIGKALRRKHDFHLVVLTSTVMPGSTGGVVREVLETASRKHMERDFGLCYNPEFIALGSVVRDFLNPDFLLIGESDPRSGQALENIYHRVCENKPPAARLNFVNAEIAKLAVNTFVTTKISFANMLARICERVPGSSVDEVTRALGLDSRIGPKYLKGAISYGGPCFPRDNLALASLARLVGAPADIAQATDSFNRAQIRWLADFVQNSLSGGGPVGILGLTYKPYTDVTEESAGSLLYRELISRRVPVVAFDPAAHSNSPGFRSNQIELTTSAPDCVAQADVVVIATPWPEFSKIESATWARPLAPRIVVDCWRSFDFLRHVAGVSYVGLGSGTASADTARTRMSASTAELRQARIGQFAAEGGTD
jgi:UDPglucose 6-dehydrogenase